LGFTILIELIKETAALEIGRISNEGRQNTWKKRKKKQKKNVIYNCDRMEGVEPPTGVGGGSLKPTPQETLVYRKNAINVLILRFVTPAI
jgi:hypothetical protein